MNTSPTPRISVIVPAYNAEKTLGQCVESILGQSFVNFELIIVDDGSKDRTAAICDDYAARDPRVKVVHKRNGGVGAARNSGLDIAGGEFIAFVDSDDTVKDVYLADLYDHIDDDVDLVISNASVFKYGRWIGEKYEAVSVRDDDFDEIFAKNILHTSPWSKLYRASVIAEHNIRFPDDMPIGEDAVFLLTCMAYSGAVCVTDNADYLYNSADGQLTKKLYGFNKEKQISSKIDEAVDLVAGRKNVRTSRAVSRLDRIKSLYRERVLDSVYMRENFSRKTRMEAIRSIKTDNLRVFPLGSCGIRAWLLSHLLKYRMLNTYDIIRDFAKKTR